MLFLLAFVMNINAQNDSIIRNTKYDALESRKGVVIKFVDKKTNGIIYNNNGWLIKCVIRKYIETNHNDYFLVLGTNTKIEYSDLVEVNKAFDRLFKEVDTDCSLNPDYLENKFITVDGFKIGYYIEKGKPTWFVDPDIYTHQNTLYIKKPYEFAEGLKKVQGEIEEMINSEK